MISERLKAARISKNLSEQDMSYYLGIEIQQYLSYENNSAVIGVGKLYQICNILNLAPSYFFN
ncbi:helix-turn-helix domain-containing protein [Rickettsiales bacterium LUAb2]